jgi:chaperone BCS1
MPSWNEILEYVKTQLSTNQFFSAAAFASVLTAILMSLKGVPKAIWDRISRITTYTATIYQTDDLYYHLTDWFNDAHKSKVRNVEYLTSSSDGDEYPAIPGDEESQEDKGIREVPVDDHFYKWVGWRLIKISYGKEKLENASSLKSAYLKNYTFKGLFASKAIRSLMDQVYQEYKLKGKSAMVYQSEHNYFRRITKVGGKKITDVILNSDVKEKILSDIEIWKKSKPDYVRRGIPYRRGHCYHGPPGTGKTTIVKAIAKEFGFNVYSIDLKKSEDDCLIHLLRDIEPGSILLFEDIDSTFDGRKSLNKTGVTFSGFLNALDGIVEMDGVLVIITTNHIEKMDPALLRAGRMDLKVEVGYSSEKEISSYLSSFYEKEIKISAKGLLPMVEVQNACLENKMSPEKAIWTIEDLLRKNVYS